MEERNKLLSRHELAVQLGISVRTLDRWHSNRAGPKRIQIGGSVKYRISDVENWIVSLEAI